MGKDYQLEDEELSNLTYSDSDSSLRITPEDLSLYNPFLGSQHTLKVTPASARRPGDPIGKRMDWDPDVLPPAIEIPGVLARIISPQFQCEHIKERPSELPGNSYRCLWGRCYLLCYKSQNVLGGFEGKDSLEVPEGGFERIIPESPDVFGKGLRLYRVPMDVI
ncbi:hypothetical protein Ptr902_08587 [Pyrenophora tritici-repentis]|nr:hypothetical protein Ptr902_08587 [Pyrenophora tritici-repentis]